MIVAQADAVSVTQLHLLSMIMTQADVVSVTQLLDPYLGPSMARAEEAVAALPSLDVWHRALEGAFASRPKLSPVIPMGFGGNENIDAAAWHGDEAIGSAVAKVVEAKSVKGKDNLTRRYGALASNADLAKRMVEVLPEHVLALLPPPGVRARRVHDCGTLIEACVKFDRALSC